MITYDIKNKFYSMTRYDKLMVVIKDHLYQYYILGQQGDGWDESDAKESAYAILQAVKEFQSMPFSKAWRASD